MRSVGSVTQLISDVRMGCEIASARLWAVFHHDLMRFARSRLRGSHTAMSDEEDIVVTAFSSFLRRTGNGSYPNLGSRSEIWRLLITIASRKIINQVRDQKCTKRRPSGAANVTLDKVDVASSTPTPEFLVSVSDELEHFLEKCDKQLAEIVLMRLHGHSNSEIATLLECSVSTVNRRLLLIEEKLKLEIDE